MLEVEKRFETHPQAAAWFRKQGLPLPNNCMVAGNPPHRLSETGGQHGCTGVKEWDAWYQRRADTFGVVLACRKHYLNLSDPPAVTREDWLEWNEVIPATRNPKNTPHLWEPLLWRATSRNSPA